jgi:hypothetical protein
MLTFISKGKDDCKRRCMPGLCVEEDDDEIDEMLDDEDMEEDTDEDDEAEKMKELVKFKVKRNTRMLQDILTSTKSDGNDER